MAFSLEATLVVPLVMGTCLGLIIAAPALYNEVYDAARLEVQASARSLGGNSLYQARILIEGDAWTTSLQTSPQAMIEILSMILDDGQLLLRLLPATGTADAGEGSGS